MSATVSRCLPAIRKPRRWPEPGPCAASIFGEPHLRQVLSLYAAYYNQMRTHLALGKDAPLGRAVERSGVIVAIPILSGLHHQYVRI